MLRSRFVSTPHRRLGALAVALASLMAGASGCGDDPAPHDSAASTSTPSPTATATATTAAEPGMFVSERVPYQIKIPSDWQIDALSQGGDSDADEWTSPSGAQRLMVGRGFPEPGETVADRVTRTRADETAGGCTSDPNQDSAINVAGRRGVLWSYTCAPVEPGFISARNAYFLSAQTIYQRPDHHRVGYRVTVVVPLTKQAQAKPLLDRFLSGLAFLDDSHATDD